MRGWSKSFYSFSSRVGIERRLWETRYLVWLAMCICLKEMPRKFTFPFTTRSKVKSVHWPKLLGILCVWFYWTHIHIFQYRLDRLVFHSLSFFCFFFYFAPRASPWDPREKSNNFTNISKYKTQKIHLHKSIKHSIHLKVFFLLTYLLTFIFKSKNNLIFFSLFILILIYNTFFFVATWEF